MPRNLITIDETRFIFATNFAGDPAKGGKFRSTARYGNIIIPQSLAAELLRDGFNVRETTPRPTDGPDFEPEHFIKIVARYDGPYPPKIYLVSGDSEPVLMDKDSLVDIDRARIARVRVVLNPWKDDDMGKSSFYIRTMYVEQDVESDPFARYYARPRRRDDDEEQLPF